MPTHDERIDGLRIIITGGSSGIGLSTAQRLGRAGAQVVLLARGADGLADAATRVPGCAGIVIADVGDAKQAHRAVEEAVGLLGGLDVTVAAAGAGAYGPFLDMDAEDYARTVTVTLIGIMNTAHAAVPHLEASGGTLVVVGSVAGRVPVPWLAAYTAAKHGVRGFVRSLDAELRAARRGVSIALIAPGPVDTPFWRRAPTPDGRLPPEIRGAYRADDIAAEIVRAIATPGRLERTVGGLMLPAILLDALVPNLVQAPLGMLARLGWRAREGQERSDDDGLVQPTTHARTDGGLLARPSGLQKQRGLVTTRP
jgi:NAD(P)-dependent dehydrogenase (short-subunit alcohol dehydrogenase family)